MVGKGITFRSVRGGDVFKSIVSWILKMVDIEVDLVDGNLCLTVDFASSTIIKRCIHVGRGVNAGGSTGSPRGVL